MFERWADPSNWREPVYAWLWVNHAEVLDLRTRWDRLSWKGIARVMVKDGVKGSRGEPPNANSVRRVWNRVCQDKVDRDARDAERGK